MSTATQPDNMHARMTRNRIAYVYIDAIAYHDKCHQSQLAFVRGWCNAADSGRVPEWQEAREYLRDHAQADLRAIAAADRSPRSAAEIEGILWGEGSES